MNKTGFIKTVADKAQLTQKDTKAVYETIVETIYEKMRRGEHLTLVGFGLLYVPQRAARKGINPRSGKTIDIKTSKSIKFKPSTTLDINKKQAQAIHTDVPRKAIASRGAWIHKERNRP